MTFQPTFFTSKDTVRKFPVSERVGALTAQAGGTHVDRFAKARQMKEEAERKVSSYVGGFVSVCIYVYLSVCVCLATPTITSTNRTHQLLSPRSTGTR